MCVCTHAHVDLPSLVSAVMGSLYAPVPALFTAAILMEYLVAKFNPEMIVSVVPLETIKISVLPLPCIPYSTE